MSLRSDMISDALRGWLGRWKDNLTADPLSAFGFEVQLDGCVGLLDDTMPTDQEASATPAT